MQRSTVEHFADFHENPLPTTVFRRRATKFCPTRRGFGAQNRLYQTNRPVERHFSARFRRRPPISQKSSKCSTVKRFAKFHEIPYQSPSPCSTAKHSAENRVNTTHAAPPCSVQPRPTPLEASPTPHPTHPTPQKIHTRPIYKKERQYPKWKK